MEKYGHLKKSLDGYDKWYVEKKYKEVVANIHEFINHEASLECFDKSHLQ